MFLHRLLQPLVEVGHVAPQRPYLVLWISFSPGAAVVSRAILAMRSSASWDRSENRSICFRRLVSNGSSLSGCRAAYGPWRQAEGDEIEGRPQSAHAGWPLRTRPRPSTSTSPPGPQLAMSCVSARRRPRRTAKAGKPNTAGTASSNPR